MSAADFKRKYGQWVLITGASDGIGRAFAERLAAKGLDLVLVARRESVLEALADTLKAQYRIQTHVIAADLSQSRAVEQVFAETADLPVGLLVASAGFGVTGRLTDSTLEAELAMLDVNVRAVLTMTYHYGRMFAAQQHGGIILFSSVMAFQGAPMSANYAGTKAYIQTLAEGLHVELSPLGVDVIASAPGPVNSGFAARADMRMGVALTADIVAKETLDALGKRAVVMPGMLSKVMIYSLTSLPRALRVRMMGMLVKGMTRHQQHAP